ncbi:MAG: CRISPR-associated endonuclease Cas2 [bacterium]|nr:CRISPR-associated endonuclease Cas2 [bacterium]MDZ4205923.1 CRISPR-associated endonuclease Cas2 [Patescibacteria group bacterium]
MGKLEKENKRNIRRTELQHAILSTVATAGILSVGLIAPQVIGALSKLGLLPYSRENEVVTSAASRLRNKGLLKFEDGHYTLTSQGEKILSHWELADYKLTKPKKWDKKWRIVIFDIPEKKKGIRDQVRQIFIATGFRRLQDSVWVYPYDCEDVIGLLKTDFGIGRDLLYVIADQIENDKYLRREFDLL